MNVAQLAKVLPLFDGELELRFMDDRTGCGCRWVACNDCFPEVGIIVNTNFDKPFVEVY